MHKIKYYQIKFSNIPILDPDSKEFTESRQYAFGGSEMGTITGTNPYESLPDLVFKKQNKINCHNEATLWGRLFEPIAKTFIEKKYGKIYNFGSIPHPKYPISYSPDGLILNENKDDIQLLEIKCPMKRNIFSIPKHYKHQVLTGLNIFAASQCVFAQFKFRRCKMDTAPWSTRYDFEFHFDYRNKRSITTPISYGYFYWAIPESIHKGLLDLSTVKDMNETIKEYKEKMEKENEKFNYQVIKEQPFHTGNGLLLMWKLFLWDTQIINEDPDFLKHNSDILWKYYTQLIDIQPVKSQGEFPILEEQKEET